MYQSNCGYVQQSLDAAQVATFEASDYSAFSAITSRRSNLLNNKVDNDDCSFRV